MSVYSPTTFTTGRGTIEVVSEDENVDSKLEVVNYPRLVKYLHDFSNTATADLVNALNTISTDRT